MNERQVRNCNAGLIYFYFTALGVLMAYGAPSSPLVYISVSFMLKNRLHVAPSGLALFGFLTVLPLKLSFLVGLARDRWSPLGMRDRGFFLLFAPLTAFVFCWMAYIPLSFVGLVGGMMLARIAYAFVGAAYAGLQTLVAQERQMSGRLASMLGIVGIIPYLGSGLAAGWFVERVSPRHTFLTVAALTLTIAIFAMWKPRAVFEHTYDQPIARGRDVLGDLKRLFRHKTIYAVVLINSLFLFSPAQGTVFQYYLTDRLHAPDAFYADYGVISLVSFAPGYFLYAWLCKRVILKKLLRWGTLIVIPAALPLAFIHSGDQAMILAVPTGLVRGIATAAYSDLTMRSCPPGLQGTFMSLIGGVVGLANSGGDMLGAAIYDAHPAHGMLYDVIATALACTLILPTLRLIPKELITTSDGEPNPAIAAGADVE